MFKIYSRSDLPHPHRQAKRRQKVIDRVSASAAILAILAGIYLRATDLAPRLRLTSIQWGSLAILVVVPAAAEVRRYLRRTRDETRGRTLRQLEDQVRAMNYQVSEKSGVAYQDIGTNVWLVETFRGQQYLDRLTRVRLVSDVPRTTGVDWTKGKGVIGQVWVTGRPVILDGAAWDAQVRLPGGDTSGFTRDEVEQVRGKYGCIVAAPIVDGDVTIGVVSLNGPPGSYPALLAAAADKIVTAQTDLFAHLVVPARAP